MSNTFAWTIEVTSQVETGRSRPDSWRFTFVTDGLMPTTDMLTNRGMMATVLSTFRLLRSYAEAEGFDGLV